MDMLANSVRLQENVKFNSNTVKRNTFNLGASSFKNSLENSKRDIRRNDNIRNGSLKKDVVRKDSIKKDITRDELAHRKDEFRKTEKPPKDKNIKKVDSKTSDNSGDLAKEDKLKELSEKFSKEISAKLEEKSEDLSKDVLGAISEIISALTNRDEGEILNSLEEKLSADSVDGVLISKELSLKQAVLSEIVGEKNPLFSDDEDVKMLKDVMESIEKLMQDSEEENEIKLDFREVLNFQADSALSSDGKSEQTMTDKSASGLIASEEVSDGKVEVHDMRRDRTKSADGVKTVDFAEILQGADTNKSSEIAEIKSLDKVQATKVVEQIITKAKVVLVDGKSTMEMKLNPENLGKVAVKLISENGNLKGTFTVENVAVKEALEQNLISLRQELTDSGIKVDKIEVSLASSNENKEFSDNEGNSEQFNKRNKKRSRFSLNTEIEGISMADVDDGEILSDSLVNFSA